MKVWLVNTGWSGGAYGVWKRVPLSHTRSMIDAIYSGSLGDAPVAKDPTFGFNVITECPDVPSNILIPRNAWSDPEEYDRTASKLATLFVDNFKEYESGVSPEVKAAGPTSS